MLLDSQKDNDILISKRSSTRLQHLQEKRSTRLKLCSCSESKCDSCKPSHLNEINHGEIQDPLPASKCKSVLNVSSLKEIGKCNDEDVAKALLSFSEVTDHITPKNITDTYSQQPKEQTSIEPQITKEEAAQLLRDFYIKSNTRTSKSNGRCIEPCGNDAQLLMNFAERVNLEAPSTTSPLPSRFIHRNTPTPMNKYLWK